MMGFSQKLFFTAFIILSAAIDGIRGEAIVTGTVFCDQCKDGQRSLFDYPLSGIRVTVSCPDGNGQVTMSREETTDWLGSYSMRFDGTPDLRNCYAQVSAQQQSSTCGSAAGPAQNLRLMFSMFTMEMYVVDSLLTQPSQPMSFCSNTNPGPVNPPTIPVPAPPRWTNPVPTPVNPPPIRETPPLYSPPVFRLPPLPPLPPMPPVFRLPPLPPLPPMPPVFRLPPLPPLPPAPQVPQMPPLYSPPVFRLPPLPPLPPAPQVPQMPPLYSPPVFRLPPLPPLPPMPPLPPVPRLPFFPPMPPVPQMPQTPPAPPIPQMPPAPEIPPLPPMPQMPPLPFFPPMPPLPFFPPMPPLPFYPPLPPMPFSPTAPQSTALNISAPVPPMPQELPMPPMPQELPMPFAEASACPHQNWTKPEYKCYWRGINPDTKVAAVFGPLASMRYGTNMTLMQALGERGEPYRTLLRESTTALLNSYNSFRFTYNTVNVITDLNLALVGSQRRVMHTAFRFLKANSGFNGNITCKFTPCR